MLHLNPYKNIKSILLVKTWTQYWPNIKKEIKYPGTGQSEITTKIYTEKHNTCSSSRDDHESEIEIMFQDFDSFLSWSIASVKQQSNMTCPRELGYFPPNCNTIESQPPIAEQLSARL